LTHFPSYPNFLSNEYATRYLEALGATSSKENVRVVLEAMPIEKCSVKGVWRKDGALQDAIVVRAYGGEGSGSREGGRTETNPASRIATPTFGGTYSDHGNNDAPPASIAHPLAHTDLSKLSPRSTPLPPSSLYTPSQRTIILQSLLLNLLKPLTTLETDITHCIELFLKKFPFDDLVRDVVMNREGREKYITLGGANNNTEHKIGVVEELGMGKKGRKQGPLELPGSPSKTPQRPGALTGSAHSYVHTPGTPGSTRGSTRGSPPRASLTSRLTDKHDPTHFKSSQLVSSLKAFLLQPSVVALIDVTMHYLYWNIIHHTAVASERIKGTIEHAKELVVNTPSYSYNTKQPMVADVTECYEDMDNSANAIKDGDDFVRDLGVTQLNALVLRRLGSAENEKLNYKVNELYTKVRSDCMRRLGRKGTDLYLPMLLLCVRNAADNVFVREYKYMHASTSTYVGESNMLKPRLWDCVHREITRIYDPNLYLCHLPPFGNVNKAVKRIDDMKLGTMTQQQRVGQDYYEKMYGERSVREREARNWGNDEEEEYKRYREEDGGGGSSPCSPRQHRNIQSKSILRAKKNYYECSTVVGTLIGDAKSAGARGMLRDKKTANRFDSTVVSEGVQSYESKKTHDKLNPRRTLSNNKSYEEDGGLYMHDEIQLKHELGASSRADLMKTVMLSNSQRYMSRYNRSKRRQDMDRAVLLREEVKEESRKEHDEFLVRKLERKEREWGRKGITSVVEGRWM
jgi:hypothetical protein